MAVNVKTQDFEEQVAKASGPVLVDFWASWCGPCRMLAPVIDQLAAEQTDVKVCKVNIDEEPGLAQRFGVMSIPTVVLFENGQEKNRSVGLVPKEKLLALLEKHDVRFVWVKGHAGHPENERCDRLAVEQSMKYK